MPAYSLVAARANFPRLVRSIETGEETVIVIARRGVPVARLVPVANRRIGVACGQFKAPAGIDAMNAEIADMFAAREL